MLCSTRLHATILKCPKLRRLQDEAMYFLPWTLPTSWASQLEPTKSVPGESVYIRKAYIGVPRPGLTDSEIPQPGRASSSGDDQPNIYKISLRLHQNLKFNIPMLERKFQKIQNVIHHCTSTFKWPLIHTDGSMQ